MKETLVSIIIAFILAFVFRAFVIEAFIIPTGSMAPTLMGAHMRFQGEHTGYNWPVGPQFHAPVPPGAPTGEPLPIQGSGNDPVIVHDPMTDEELRSTGVRRHTGDRILVFKYLYSIYDPKRWDVVVFKAPHEPQTNYIKRLVGLPGEWIALIDGDAFVRRAAVGEPASAAADDWTLPGWSIQRKGERAQRAAWQDVYSSEYEPLGQVRDSMGRAFRSPWLGEGSGWQIDGRRSYEYAGAGPTRLTWDNQAQDANGRLRWPITNFCFYNDTNRASPQNRGTAFAVHDLNLRCGVEAVSGPVEAAAAVRAHRHEFRAEIKGSTVTLKMGLLPEVPAGQRPGTPATWITLGTGTLPHAIEPGRPVANLEFWLVDQSLSLWYDGREIVRGEYAWTPEERLAFTFGTSVRLVVENFEKSRGNTLGDFRNYIQPELWWEFSGPVRLHRVGVQRDIFYEPFSPGRAPLPPRATHPLFTMRLGPDHFFVCGDNSPQSLDARLWGLPDPWVAAEIDNAEGIVPRDLMIGRAFFVYFPSMIRGRQSGLPVPDFGRMRWIW